MELPNNRRELKLFIESYKNSIPEDGELTRGFLLAHYRTKSPAEFREYFRSLYGEKWSDSLNNSVRSAINKTHTFVRDQAGNISKRTTAEKVVKQLNERYTLPVTRKRPFSDIEPISADLDHVPETPPATPTHHETSTHDYITPKRSKLCTERCHNMRHEASNLRKELGRTKDEAEKLRARVAVKFKYEPRILNQTITRLQTQMKKLRDKSQTERAKARQAIRELHIQLNAERIKVKQVEPLKIKVENLQEQIRKLKDQKTHAKRYHSTKNSDSVLLQKFKSSQSENKLLKEKLSAVENQLLELEEKENNVIETMDGRQFDVKTRMAINHCTQRNVSQQHASNLVRDVVNTMTGQIVGKLPGPSTTANITREFGIISDIQCGTIMSESSNGTFGWDGTTKDGTHINEMNVKTATAHLTLGVSEMGGGCTTDYRDCIRDRLGDITNRTATFLNTDPAETSKKIHDSKCAKLDEITYNHLLTPSPSQMFH